MTTTTMPPASHHHPLPGMPFPPPPMRCIPCGRKQLVEGIQEAKEDVVEQDLLPEAVDEVLEALEEEAEEEAVLDLLPFLCSSLKSNVALLSMAIPQWMDPMTTTTMRDLGARSGLPSALDGMTLTTTETLEEQTEPEVTTMPVKMKRCWRQRRLEGRLGMVYKPRAIRKTSPH